MSKISLREVKLINWYGFVNETIPLSDHMTLITGENESGKSTILDAIKYAYTGDTKFNEATSKNNTGIGKRNLVSYTRCLLDPSAGIYARPADKMPNVFTHIALEYYDEINQSAFVLGVVLETSSTDNLTNGWYAAEKKTLRDLCFTYEDNGVEKPYDASDFQRKNGLKLKTKKEGIILFMQMTGLKLPYQEVSTYQRKLRNIMAYNPAAKIQEFIKESVLEEHPVRFEKLKDAKQNIERINNSLEQINQEIQDLDEILDNFGELDKQQNRLLTDDIKRKYQNVLECQKNLQGAEQRIEENRLQCRELETKIEARKKEIRNTQEQYDKVKDALQTMDASQAITASQRAIEGYEERLQKLRREVSALESFLQEIRVALEHTEIREAEQLFDDGMPEKLMDPKIDAVEKQLFLESLKRALQAARDAVLQQKYAIDDELKKIQKECVLQNEILQTCKKKKADFTFAGEQLAFIKEVNLELEQLGIPERAKMACEYVIGIKDEEWRNAIEAFLGVHRYAVIVSPTAFDIANRMLDKSGHRYLELVNTKRLMRKELVCEEDAVFHLLDIQNPHAAAYFKFWLGRIHAVPIEEVPNYDNAMSKEGKLSRNMAVTYLNFKKIKSYCLGEEAIELNRAAAQKRLNALEKEEAAALKSQKEQQEKTDSLRHAIDSFREFNLNAHREAAQTEAQLREENKHYKELLEAQRNNVEFMALSEQISRLAGELDSQRNGQNEMERQKARLEIDTENQQDASVKYKSTLQEASGILDEERMMHASVYEKAIEEYDRFRKGEAKIGGLMKQNSRERVQSSITALQTTIQSRQMLYNNRKPQEERLPLGTDAEGSYQKRKTKIWIDDLQGIQEKMREQTRKYEDIFKHEFVLSIYEHARTALADIREINKELHKLKFSTQYQFEVKMLRDHSDYAKVLNYAEYLQSANDLFDDQISFDSAGHGKYEREEIEKREKEIKNIINKMIDKNDLSEIKRFADYRNYMSYEILVTDDTIKEGKLSKTVGYNSGAGTQIPYTLILSAALSMLYNARVNSVRLLFIDEPFEKMSDHNIKLMLDFFQAQNFQVIFCAPPNRLESIGSECSVIIPLLKLKKEDMRIGKVKFHEQ